MCWGPTAVAVAAASLAWLGALGSKRLDDPPSYHPGYQIRIRNDVRLIHEHWFTVMINYSSCWQRKGASLLQEINIVYIYICLNRQDWVLPVNNTFTERRRYPQLRGNHDGMSPEDGWTSGRRSACGQSTWGPFVATSPDRGQK